MVNLTLRDGFLPGEGAKACAEPFVPCGGELVGQWQLRDSCVTDPVSSFLDECPEATMATKSYQASGTIDLRADGTVVSNVSSQEAYVVDVPLACLTVSCPQLQSLMLESPEEDFGAGAQVRVVCVEAGTLCRCDLSIALAVGPETDTYQVAGTQLTVVEPDGEIEVMQFCVESDTLRFEMDGVVLTSSRR